MFDGDRPILTLPEAEAEALARVYRGAGVILEYGSGGSTALAADMGKTVFSVESDAEWCAKMQAWFDGNPQNGRVTLHHADIGPTKKWGMPTGAASFRRFPDYALSVWDAPGFQHPDVVLIDGRFRPACLLATAFFITRPVTVLFDDYALRPAYHGIETMFRPTAMHGRMAEFAVDPTPLTADRLSWVMGWFLKPQ
jgi:hypothetical protein